MIPLAVLLVAHMQSPAELAMRHLESGFRMPSGFVREKLGSAQPVFNWGLGVFLSADNALARLNPARKAVLRRDLAMAERYWNGTGFDVQPGPNFPNDLYYDDNAWMVLALVESYEILKERHWLDLAGKALAFVLSGRDRALGGGIWWRTADRRTKNTCSNGPSAAACLAVFQHTRDPKLLENARGLYSWTVERLRDPSDALFWDNIARDGTVEPTKWSYNTALMIRAARGLARATGEARYSEDVAAMERAARARWVRPDGRIDDEIQFAHLLFENITLSPAASSRAVESLLAGRDGEGNFGARWGVSHSSGPVMLLHQASAVRALAEAELLGRGPRTSVGR